MPIALHPPSLSNPQLKETTPPRPVKTSGATAKSGALVMGCTPAAASSLAELARRLPRPIRWGINE